MAIYRSIHTSFWSDLFVTELTPEQKFFFIYLLTNEKTRQCGIYEIGKRQISFDTGYNIDTINKLISFFQESGKIKFSETTSEIAIFNWAKYNSSNSPKVEACIAKELKTVKNKVLIEYVYGIDTRSQEKEVKKEKEKEVKTSTIEKKIDGEEFFENDIIEVLEENEDETFSQTETSLKKEKDSAQKEKSFEHAEFIEVYDKFFKELTGLPPKIDSSDGKAIKEIIPHCKRIAKDGHTAIEIWETILTVSNWHKLDNFSQGQTKLSQINSRFNNIVSQIKSHSQPQRPRNTQITDRIQLATEINLKRIEDGITYNPLAGVFK